MENATTKSSANFNATKAAPTKTTTFKAVTTPNSTDAAYCYEIDMDPSIDTIVAAIFILFLFVLLVALIWRIISGIQTIRRYRYKIMIISQGPILDAKYFDNAPNYAKVDQSPAAPLLNNQQK